MQEFDTVDVGGDDLVLAATSKNVLAGHAVFKLAVSGATLTDIEVRGDVEPDGADGSVPGDGGTVLLTETVSVAAGESKFVRISIQMPVYRIYLKGDVGCEVTPLLAYTAS